MAILDRTFTWWNARDLNWLLTRFRGEEVGRDDRGNIYYRHAKNPRRRWVIYPADNDGSRVPAEWSLWLRGTIRTCPTGASAQAQMGKPSDPNATGTMAAFRPDGSLRGGSGRPRPAVHEPWTPE